MTITKIGDNLMLNADEGKVIFNGEAYNTTVFVGDNDSVDNWVEIELTDEIKAAVLSKAPPRAAATAETTESDD